MTTNVPPQFPLPRERFETQRRLLAAHVADHRAHTPRRARLRSLAVSVAVALAVLVVTGAGTVVP